MSDSWDERAKAAAAALPGVKVDLGRFAALLKDRARAAGGSVNSEDLLLAHAALERDPIALRRLDRLLVRCSRAIEARFGALPVDELSQQVRHRVLVGEGSRGPRLLRYTGRGALATWLRAVATSLAIDESRRRRHESDLDEEELLATASTESGPETRLLDAQHKAHFSAAFREALATLSAQERTVMRMKFVDGLAVEDIGRAFAVHRTTALRWLERAHAQLLMQTRKSLAARLGLRSRELDSLLLGFEPSISDRLSRLLVR